MALKPIPRLILIITIVAAVGFAVMKLIQPEGSSIQANIEKPSSSVVQVNPVASSTTAASSNSMQTILEKGVVRVGVQSPAKPFYSIVNGAPTGFNVDFLKLLFAQSEFTQKHPQIVIDTNLAVDTYEEVPKTLLKVDARGKTLVDIAIDGLTFSDDDLKGVVYSIPYVSDFGYALIAPSRAIIKDTSELKGQTIGVLQGDPDVKAYVVRQFPDSKIIELSDAAVNGVRDWISRAIKSGQVDAVVYDYPFAVSEVAGTDLQFAFTKLQGSDIRYKIGVRKGDDQLLQGINIAIRKTKESPEYLELLQKYFVSKNAKAARGATGAETLYKVKAGDTLSTISQAILGDKLRYKEIEYRNNLPNPNLIQIGQKLVIPKT